MRGTKTAREKLLLGGSVVRQFLVLRLRCALILVLFTAEGKGSISAGPYGFALVEHMNRFSTADKLNRSRPAAPPAASANFNSFGTGSGGGNSGATSSGQSYKDQLLSVILQNAANGSFTHPASSSVAASAESHEHFAPPQHQHPVEEPNGNMKSKDFGNGEGELDMLFGFFVMNGACIVFFLLFGVCVICNCAARKPKFHGSEQKEKKRKKPTVSRLVAAMAPGGFGQRAKANAAAAAAAKAEQNATATNIPLLQANSMGSRRGSAASIRLDQNGNGGQGGGGPLVANHRSPTPRSFRSLVAKAMATSRSGDSVKGSGSLAVNIEPDSYSEPEPPPPCQQERPRRQSRSSPSGGNSPARRMSALSSALEESSRHIAKMSHCSANECCSLHVLEVPVEVEVHHCPSPTGGPELLAAAAASLGAHHPKLAPTRSMPLDLARAALIGEQPQQICLTEHGQFIVRRDTQPPTGIGRWAAHGSFRSKHRCSLVVPMVMPCGECRVQIESADDGEQQQTAAAGNGQEHSQHAEQGASGDEEGGSGGEGAGSGSSRKPSASGEFSVVRQNLLGPLSFDDLYYIT